MCRTRFSNCYPRAQPASSVENGVHTAGLSTAYTALAYVFSGVYDATAYHRLSCRASFIGEPKDERVSKQRPVQRREMIERRLAVARLRPCMRKHK
jgi:hypothetical protein